MAHTNPSINAVVTTRPARRSRGWTECLAALSPEEATFARRGFRRTTAGRRDHLETIGRTFIGGYNAALAKVDVPELRDGLDRAERPLRGFAYEGAAMGVAVADAMPWAGRPRLPAFLEAAINDHSYLAHVGVGWAMARMPWRRRVLCAALDPLLRFLAIDGRGFHDVYFRPSRLHHGFRGRSADMRRAWDQGAGRAVWFVAGSSVDAAVRLIEAQADGRRADLFAGIGLAATYAGGATADDLRRLRVAAGPFADHLAQGSAFALEARRLGRNRAAESDAACRILTDLEADTAITIVRAERPPNSEITAIERETGRPAYEVWRGAVRAALATSQIEGRQG